MKFDLIPQVVIIFSTGVIIFILGKNIPKIKEAQERDLLFEKENKKKTKRFSYLYGKLVGRIKKDNYQEKSDLVWKWLEKSLRKVRIKFLKLDNKIIFVLEKLKKKHTKYENDSNNKIGTEEKRNNKYKNFGGAESDIIDGIELEKSEKNDFKFGGLNDDAERDGFINSFESELKINRIASEEEKMKKKERSKNEDEYKDETKSEVEDKVGLKEKDIKVNKEKKYIDLILKNPGNIKAYWKLGIVYSRRKEYKDSILCFRQIIKIDPGYTKAKKKIVDLIRRMKKDKKVDGEK